MGKARIEFKWAVIAAVLGLILMILVKVLGFRTAETYQTGGFIDFFGSILIFAIIWYLGLKEKKTIDLEGNMTYGQGFWTGAIMTLLSIPLNSLAAWLYNNLIDPDFVDNWNSFSEAAGTLEESRRLTMNMYYSTTVMMVAILGLLLSLIIPLFVRSKE